MTNPVDTPRRRMLWRWWLVVVLPVICIGTAYGSYRHPGDEYGMFFFGAVGPGSAVIVLLDRLGLWHNGSIPISASIVIAISGAAVALFAWFAMLLRVRWWMIGVLWLIHFGALMRSSLGTFPTYERAMAKNGSLEAYVYSCSNLGLYGALIVCVAVMGLYRLYRRMRPTA